MTRVQYGVRLTITVLVVSFATFGIVDTRMNLVQLYLVAIIKQLPFLTMLGLDPRWFQFLSDRKTTAERTRWEVTLSNCADRTR